MNKKEILEKSRADHKYEDFPQKELDVHSGYVSCIVGACLCGGLCLIQLCADQGWNWGFYSIITSMSTADYLYKYKKLGKKEFLRDGIICGVATLIMAGLFSYPYLVQIVFTIMR